MYLKRQNETWVSPIAISLYFSSFSINNYYIIAALGYIHTKPNKFENATFFLRIVLLFTRKQCFQSPNKELSENALQSDP